MNLDGFVKFLVIFAQKYFCLPLLKAKKHFLAISKKYNF